MIKNKELTRWMGNENTNNHRLPNGTDQHGEGEPILLFRSSRESKGNTPTILGTRNAPVAIHETSAQDDKKHFQSDKRGRTGGGTIKMTDTPTVEQTLYKLNGTLLREGDLGRALWKIADELEELNRQIRVKLNPSDNLVS